MSQAAYDALVAENLDLKRRIDEAWKAHQDACLDALAAEGQAQEAYTAQLKAERERDEARRDAERLHEQRMEAIRNEKEALRRLEEVRMLIDIALTPNVERRHVNKLFRAWREEYGQHGT